MPPPSFSYIQLDQFLAQHQNSERRALDALVALYNSAVRELHTRPAPGDALWRPAAAVPAVGRHAHTGSIDLESGAPRAKERDPTITLEPPLVLKAPEPRLPGHAHSASSNSSDSSPFPALATPATLASPVDSFLSSAPSSQVHSAERERGDRAFDRAPKLPYQSLSQPLAPGHTPAQPAPHPAHTPAQPALERGFGDLVIADRPSETGATPPTPETHAQRAMADLGPYADAATAPPPRRAIMTPNLLQHTTVAAVSSSVTRTEKGKEVVTVLCTVTVAPPADHPDHPDRTGAAAVWAVEKRLADLGALDAAVRSAASRSDARLLPPVPEKALFRERDVSPFRNTQRKRATTTLLAALLALPTRNKGPLVQFLTSDILTLPASQACALTPTHLAQIANVAPPRDAVRIEGWLTHRVQRRWAARYCRLSLAGPVPVLRMHPAPDGPCLVEISLAGAILGRQSAHARSRGDDTEDYYDHAFLIRLNDVAQDTLFRETGIDMLVLCAETDAARDAWVIAVSVCLMPRGAGDGRSASDARSAPSPDVPGTSLSPAFAGAFVQHLATPSIDSTSTASTVAPSGHVHTVAPSVSSRSVSTLGNATHASLSPHANTPSPHSSHNTTANTASSHNTPAPLATPLNHPHTKPTLVISSPLPNTVTSPLGSTISGPVNPTPLPNGFDFKKQQPAASETARAKKTKSAFWFSRSGSTAHAPVPGLGAVFGVPLRDAVQRSQVRERLALPSVVFRCIEYLEAKHGEREEGLFRLSGSANVIRVLRDKFNAEGDVNLVSSHEYYDPHAIAGLLKTFLREMPDPILTSALHAEFLSVIDLQTRTAKLNELTRLVQLLPTEEFTLCKYFFSYLAIIARNEETSKMSVRNLGIVFSPTLGIPAPLFTLLLVENEILFILDKETGQRRPIRITHDDEYVTFPTRDDVAHHK